MAIGYDGYHGRVLRGIVVVGMGQELVDWPRLTLPRTWSQKQLGNLPRGHLRKTARSRNAW